MGSVHEGVSSQHSDILMELSKTELSAISTNTIRTGPTSSSAEPMERRLTNLELAMLSQMISTITITEQGTHWLSASFLMLNVVLGTASLNFPAIYHKSGGLVAGAVIHLLILLLLLPSVIVLVYCSEWNKARTLQEVLRWNWGKTMEQICIFTVCIFCFVDNVSLLVVVGDQFDRAFASLYGEDFCTMWYMNRMFTIVVASAVVILPFCFLTRLDFLKHTSLLGVLAIFYIALISMVHYLRGDHEVKELKTRPENWSDVLIPIPTVLFAYQMHDSVVPIYSCFQQRNLVQFSKSFAITTFTSFIMYTIIANCGYLTFGSDVKENILLNYDAKDPWILAGVVIYALKVCSNYPIVSFIGNAAVLDFIMDIEYLSSSEDRKLFKKIRIMSILIWFISTIIIAVMVPNIGIIIKFLGCLSSIFVFVFPGLCLLKVAERTFNELAEQNKKRFFFFLSCSVFYITLGVGFFFYILYVAIKGIVDPNTTEKSVCMHNTTNT